MDYRARLYDPTIGRFVQPDSIIPSYATPQSLNRFAYVSNNPVLFTDPAGHKACEDSMWGCGYGYTLRLENTLKDRFGWKMHGHWGIDQLSTVFQAGVDISSAVGGDDKLQKLFGAVDFYLQNMGDNGRGDAHYVALRASDVASGDLWTVAHELGHGLDAGHGWKLSEGLEEFTGGTTLGGPVIFGRPLSFGGPLCGDQTAPECNDARYFYGGVPPKGSDWNFNRLEDFAESFAASVYPVEAKAFVNKYFSGDDRFGYDDYTSTARGMYMSALVYLLSH